MTMRTKQFVCQLKHSIPCGPQPRWTDDEGYCSPAKQSCQTVRWSHTATCSASSFVAASIALRGIRVLLQGRLICCLMLHHETQKHGVDRGFLLTRDHPLAADRRGHICNEHVFGTWEETRVILCIVQSAYVSSDRGRAIEMRGSGLQALGA